MRVVSLELVALSIAIAGLLGIGAYSMSAESAIELVAPSERPEYVKLTKVFFWASSAAVVAAIVAAAGAVQEQHAIALCAISTGVLVLVMVISVVWGSWFLFAA